MTLTTFDWYLIAINIAGALVYAVNTILYKTAAHRKLDGIVITAALLGGSLGIIIIIFAIDRKSVKENMMTRVVAICMLVIQTVIVLYVKGYHGNVFNPAFWELFSQNKLIIVYLIVVNAAAIAVFRADKASAVRGSRRIPIVALLGMVFIGGSAGALAGMYLFRHKTRVDYFVIGVPLIIIMQIVLILYIMNTELVQLKM